MIAALLALSFVEHFFPPNLAHRFPEFLATELWGGGYFLTFYKKIVIWPSFSMISFKKIRSAATILCLKEVLFIFHLG